MYTYIAFHYPKPEYVEELLASMRRVDVASRQADGLVSIGPWREIDGDRIVGVSVWESRAHFEAAAPAVWGVVKDDPFDLWCAKPTEDFEGESV